MRNCLTCKWRSEPLTPQCSSEPKWAATCTYPLPTMCMIDFNVTDVRRHLNLAPIIPDSPFFNESIAAQSCLTWEQQT